MPQAWHAAASRQRNSSPTFADGKLYVPILEDPKTGGAGGTAADETKSAAGTKGGFYVIKPGADKGEILAQASLDGVCLGTPTPYNGKIYMQTKSKLYCFGKKGNNPGLPKLAAEQWPKAGAAPSQRAGDGTAAMVDARIRGGST